MFDLLVEYYEDVFEDDPHSMLLAGKDADGEYVFDEECLGDPLFAKWERELAEGLEPDLEEGMGVDAKKRLLKERDLSRGVKPKMDELVFSDDFSNMDPRAQKMYESKFVSPGSAEERELMAGKILGQPPAPAPKRPARYGGKR